MTPMPGPERENDGTWIDLRLLATTDLHMQILPYDYFRDRPAGCRGLAALSNLVDEARAEAPNVLLFDNGDFLQGSPLGDLALRDRRDTGEMHPMVAAMNLLGYDAITLGNHEFNFGLPTLERIIPAFTCPVVLANVARVNPAGAGKAQPYLPPFVILDRRVIDQSGQARRLRIGVIGLVTPLIATWDREHLEGRLAVHDPVETTQALAPQMRAAGVDLVVALHHAGIGSAVWTPGMEDAAIPLAREAGIDVQILGHSHRVFPSADFVGHADVDVAGARIGGVPAVMPGACGSHLGQIDLTLNLRPGGAEILAATVCLRTPKAGVPAGRTATRIQRTMGPAHQRTLDHIRAPLGQTETPFDSYFALVAADASLSLMARAQGEFIAKALANGPWRDWPVVSAVAPFLAGGRSGPENYTDIPAGPILMRHPAEMLRFPNTVRALAVSGAELAEWLERSAALFHRILPGSRDAPLIDPAMPCYNFDVLFGVTYTVDLSAPARFGPAGERLAQGGRRITELRHDGHPIAPDDRFIVATNSYRTSGGGSFPALARPEPVLRPTELTRDVLIRHIRTAGTIRADRSESWCFAAMPGTTVLFETGPGAARALADGRGPEGRRIEPLGLTEGGFLRCRLHL